MPTITTTVVSRVGTAAGPDEPGALGRRIEEAARIPGTARLRTERQNSDDREADALARRVARDPGDTRVHVERVNLALADGDAEAAYGALVDLFIALGRRGRGVRQRLAGGVRFLIGEERYQAVVAHLDDGLAANDPLPPAASSVLSTGVCGRREVVTDLGRPSPTTSWREA
ncbi:MAG: hypothetical protein U0Q07_07080 [Acidimicrobiales bacterium]